MYDTLLQLPLFQGLCTSDFTSILEHVKFHFQKYQENEIIVRQGSTCNQLIFLLGGEIVAETNDNSNGYVLSEKLHSPYIIEPYSLFGIQTCYTATYKAQSEVNTLTIDKAFIISELNNYEIFRLNFLNILSSRCQYANQKLWDYRIGTLSEKFCQFFLSRCQREEGEKTLYITMEDLATLINETRINVSRLLNDLQTKGLLQLKRKEIFIPDLGKLTKELI